MNNPYCQSLKKDLNEKNERFIRISKLDSYYICIACEGTGLENYSRFGEEILWDGNSFCKVCNGLGIFDWAENAMCGVKTQLFEKEHNYDSREISGTI